MEELGEIRVFIESVKQNKITDDIVADFIDFIDKAPSQCVILGCTELPVLFDLAKVQLTKRIYDPLQCGIDMLKAKE